MNCPECGKPKVRYKYCSHECMKSAAARNTRLLRSDGRYRPPHIPKLTLVCLFCDASFSGHAFHKFCSSKCRQSAKLIGACCKVWFLKCLKCSSSFVARRPERKWCGPKCEPRKPRKRSPASSVKRSLAMKARYQRDSEYRQRVRSRSSRYFKERFNSDPVYRIRVNLRHRIRAKVRAPHGLYDPLIGCASTELRRHLETQFTGRMSWENYGKFWVVDHILPLASFNLQDERQRKIACHFTNLQPLTHARNSAKSAKMTCRQMHLQM